MALRLIRSLSGFNSRCSFVRSLMTSSRDLDKIQEELEKNPYYDKYASKIEALKKANPEEFNSRLKEFEDKKKPKQDQPKRRLSPTKFVKPKTLSDIMKLELLEGKSSEEVSLIWQEYHQSKDCVANVLNKDVYSIMDDKSSRYPTFIHPVPKEQGYEFYMSFFEDNVAHFTPLRKYKEHKENSPVCLEVNYFTEMSGKGVVLLRGSYDTDELNKLEANCLTSSLQLYYGEVEGKRANLLRSFNQSPDDFQHMDLIADFEAHSKPTPIG